MLVLERNNLRIDFENQKLIVEVKNRKYVLPCKEVDCCTMKCIDNFSKKIERCKGIFSMLCELAAILELWICLTVCNFKR